MAKPGRGLPCKICNDLGIQGKLVIYGSRHGMDGLAQFRQCNVCAHRCTTYVVTKEQQQEFRATHREILKVRQDMKQMEKSFEEIKLKLIEHVKALTVSR